MKVLRYKEYTFKVGDTINGVLKTFSNIDLERAKELFYEKNGIKIFRAGDKVFIPYYEELSD